MEEAKTMKTLMSSSIKLDKDEKGKSIDSTMYRGMIVHYSQLQHQSLSIYVCQGFKCEPLLVLPLHLALFPSFIAPRREPATSRAQGKCLPEPSQPEASRKVCFDTTLFSTIEDYQQYKQHFAQKVVVPERNINFFQLQRFRFEGLFMRMGWLSVVTVSEPIFPILVRAFYSRMTYGMGGLITSTVRGVEICLDSESICHIFDIAPIGLRVYESKMWPTIPRFEPKEAI
ncbi:hypothetical protein CK203_062881 [Vitis vinifera]|uniref:Uncharacterized protein n=1 Tax=Vitis vinifera TaxID=29760 RepID=A0A438FQW1_VITVI|nr:hypothetical protein CK203_062881 [Vitis vinifera]